VPSSTQPHSTLSQNTSHHAAEFGANSNPAEPDRGIRTGSITSDVDLIWKSIQQEARREQQNGSCLSHFLDQVVFTPVRLEEALAGVLSDKLATERLSKDRLQVLIVHVFSQDAAVQDAIRRDLQAVVDRDPVAGGFLTPFLFFKGFQALQAYRVAHWHWQQGDRLLAVFLQNRISEVFGVDIHPAARIGAAILMDHATSIVIGETSVIEDNVSILHEVTLGGTGKQSGDRHPKVRQGVLIGAGAKILGNVEIGAGSKVGAGSVVLDSVPAHCTVAGVPARIVARSETCVPAIDMDQQFPHHFEDGSGI